MGASAVLLAGGTGVAYAAVGGTLDVDFVVNISGSESRAATVPAGGGQLAVVKYSCNSSDCYNVRIRIPLAAGASVGTATYSSEWTETRTGGVVTWSADKIVAGATSQITFQLSAGSWTLSDGTVLSQAATISGLGSLSATSLPVALTVRAAGDSHVTVTKTAGGAIDSWTRYVASACLDSSSDPSFGPLGAQGGSTFSMTLPSGASVVDASGAAVSGRTLSWSIGAVNSYGCVTRTAIVQYSTPDLGQTKTVTAQWSGALVGESGSRDLGSANYSHTIDAQSDGGNSITAHLSALTAQVGDPLTQSYGVANNGTGVWDVLTLDAPITESFTPTSIVATAFREPGLLYIAVDGGSLALAATVAAGTSLAVDPYAATLPSGMTGLTSPSTVTQVRYVLGGLQPGDGATALAITSTVRTQTLSGSTIVTGDSFSVPATADLSTSVTPSATSYPLPLNYTVFTPAPGITVRTGGTTIANGTTTTITGSGDIYSDALVDPIVVLRLPAGLRYDNSFSVVYTAGSLPDPTVTVVENFNGVGGSLVRWTFPEGTTLARNSALRVTASVKLGAQAYGGQQFKFFFSARDDVYSCGDGWFVEWPDTGDLDNNGVTDRALCAWGDQINPTTVVGAQVIQSVKGSWDADFVAGPATSFTTPGASDALRTQLYNSGNIFLRNATVVTVLPRAGDTSILSSAGRSPATSTFPLVLRAQPVVPSLSTAVITSWTTDVGACFPELGSSPAGCVTPTWTNWSTSAPSDLAAVTALKFDFGGNQLTPFTNWTVDIPVTTPTTGTTEPEFAISNPVPNDPASDERAVASSAAAVTRVDISSALTPIESTAVTLAMPGAAGPYSLPEPDDLASSAPAGTSQSVTVTIPSGGSVTLLDAGGSVLPSNTLLVPNEGEYVLDPATGVITFTPDPNFLGTPTPVRYQVADNFGGTGVADYAPVVTAPAPPGPADATSSADGPHAQQTTFVVPAGGSISFLDPATLDPIADTTQSVPGVGEFVLDPATGTVTFTPVDGYAGTPDAVYVGIADVYGQVGEASYTVTVTTPAAPAVVDLTSSELVDTGAHTVAVAVAPRGSLVLLDGSGLPVASLVVPGVGSYVADQASGTIVFLPDTGFSGSAPAVTYRVTDSYGQSDEADYTATVTLPTPPTATDVTSTLAGAGDQTVTIPVPARGSVLLLNGLSTVASLTVPGEGEYVVDPETGVITFTPEPAFVGAASPIDFVITDAYGQTAAASYTPTVTLPPAPAPGALTSTGTGTGPHEVSAVVPRGGEVALLDSTGAEVTQLDVPGEGHYEIDPATARITFTPEPGFEGPATAIPYRVTDSYGQASDATYQPTVARPAAPSAPALSSRAAVGVAQTVTVPVAAGVRLRLLDATGSEVTRLTVPGEGEYEVDPATGEITFTPSDSFVGSATAARYRLTDAYGQVGEGSYAPTVTRATTAGSSAALPRTGLDLGPLGLAAGLMLLAGILLLRRRNPQASS